MIILLFLIKTFLILLILLNFPHFTLFSPTEEVAYGDFLKGQLTKLLLPFGSTEIQTRLNKVDLIQKDLLVSPLAKRLKPKPFKF